MRKLLAVAFAFGVVVASSEAYATWDFLYDQCGGSYTYLKGPKSSWPAWAQQDGCVKPWAENPMAVKPEKVKAMKPHERNAF